MHIDYLGAFVGVCWILAMWIILYESSPAMRSGRPIWHIALCVTDTWVIWQWGVFAMERRRWWELYRPKSRFETTAREMWIAVYRYLQDSLLAVWSYRTYGL